MHGLQSLKLVDDSAKQIAMIFENANHSQLGFLMFLQIKNVLLMGQLMFVNELVTTQRWVNGANTAGRIARKVKNKLQADLTTRTGKALKECLSQVISTHPVLREAARPKNFTPILVSKTDSSGYYGRHIDNAFIGLGKDQVRSDLPYTLFLSNPDSYLGGELQVEFNDRIERFKLPAGDMVIYPASQFHEVTMVSEGTRFACIGWIESRIPYAADREVLFELAIIKENIEAKLGTNSEELLQLTKIVVNLERRFG